MASAIFYAFLFLSFAVGFAQEADKPINDSNITLGASLSPVTNPSAWFSPSGRFAFGFYSEGSGFYVGAWLEASPGRNIIIWTANRDTGPVSKDAILNLTKDGLQLMQKNSEDIFISNFQAGRSTTASMLDSGNFIVYDVKFSSLWESFNLPTDTIISGQILNLGDELVSSISETNHSSGRFRIKMQDDYNLVMYPVNTTDTGENAYWSSNTLGEFCTGLNLDTQGSLYLLQNDSKICTLNNHGGCYTSTNASNSKNSTSKISKSGLIYRATLNIHGILQVYSHDLQSNTSTVLISIPQNGDQCIIKGTCGFNSYCTYQDAKLVCLCFPGFEYFDAKRTWIGCKQNFTSVGCSLKSDNTVCKMSALSDVVITSDPYMPPSWAGTVEDCSSTCLEDDVCVAAFFDNGQCSKEKFPLKYAYKDTLETTTSRPVTLIKVVETSPSKSDAESPAETPLITKKNELLTKILGACLAAITVLAIIAAFGFFLYRHRAQRFQRMSRNRRLDLVDDIALKPFTFEELRNATDDFKEMLGKGAFGTVFKGVLPNSEEVVAIKKLEKVIDEGEREFQTEMRVIGRTHHKNLVRLLGFCAEGPHRLLVYEYMSNGSLANFIFKADRCPEWSDRTRIAVDIAKGIHYLHEECEASIIHCDLKPENILIDDNWTAKISDFGLAKLLMPSQTRTFTGIRGTRGYLAPEWHKNAPITVKADVYSFGVVLLEIVCCRKNMDMNAEVDEIMLLEWVCSCFVTGALEKLVPDEVDMKELNRLVKVGLWCIQSEPALRPNMKNVVMMLEGNIDVSIPPPPALCL
ncbi:G-type lectin S-receptor-like serine/threonine-protein kinase LECRK3 [Canna indica]|uniref:Receptor-like serine/threonine-protein kinase n=1 Tax=Canna indica TaxID=4628 RepID=A0AAQ3QL09_9LILI|nr:G-type lectin S-receptor-like serine/threonine-protein kinase LECRK3 [Canna indica]